jgi:hypothetical protein
LTGTQVLLLVVSETGLVYTFTTVKLQPIVTKPEGKNLIQACLNAPDPVQGELTVSFLFLFWSDYEWMTTDGVHRKVTIKAALRIRSLNSSSSSSSSHLSKPCMTMVKNLNPLKWLVVEQQDPAVTLLIHSNSSSLCMVAPATVGPHQA